MTAAEKQDAIKLLTLLVEPCEGSPTAHGWQDCRRCNLIHLIENRMNLPMRLLRKIIEDLKR